jgi:hypothetical protein
VWFHTSGRCSGRLGTASGGSGLGVTGELGAATVSREVGCGREKWGTGESRCARGSKEFGVLGRDVG